MAGSGEERDGVKLTNLDGPLFDGAGVTKRDLVDYIDAMSDRLVPVLAGRPLSVIRVHRGQEAFMQKNVPKYTPDWVETVTIWAEASKREVADAGLEGATGAGRCSSTPPGPAARRWWPPTARGCGRVRRCRFRSRGRNWTT